MTKVHFSKKIEEIIEQIDFSRLGEKIAIKVHFGEKGCTTYLDPALVRKVYKKIISLGKKAALVECNVLYKGSRTTSTDHIRTAREHGFDMPIEILDGENGHDFLEINGCKIGKGLTSFDSLIVISHFKGHQSAGFGGALKNLGMGLGSRAGKLDMHSSVRPSIREEVCVGCGICMEKCNANAIGIQNRKAVIDEKKCEGCAMCIAVCPNRAVAIPWQGRTSCELQRKIAEYAKAVLACFSSTVYINVLQNITEECDCMHTVQKPIMEDVGILHSDDIVAIDQASLDLAEKFSEGKFSRINPIDKNEQIQCAKNIGLGKDQYELVEL